MADTTSAAKLKEPGAETETPSAREPEAAHGRGYEQFLALARHGRPAPDRVAALIAEHPADRDAILHYLHAHPHIFGNSFVGEVARAGQAKGAPRAAPGEPVAQAASNHPSVDRANYTAKLASHVHPKVLEALVKADASKLAGLTMDIAAGNWKGVALSFGKELAPKALEKFATKASEKGLIKALGEIGGKLGKVFGPLATLGDALINCDDAGSPQEVNIEDHIMPAENVAHEAGVAAAHNRDAAKHLHGGSKTSALLEALDDDKARLIADAAAAIYSNGHGFFRDPGRDAKAAEKREHQDEKAYDKWIGGGDFSGPH